MQIKETLEKNLNLVEGAVSGTKKSVRFARQNLESLNMGNTNGDEAEEEEIGNPARHLSGQEAREWYGLSEQQQQRFLREGTEEAEQDFRHRRSVNADAWMEADELDEAWQNEAETAYFMEQRQNTVGGETVKRQFRNDIEQAAISGISSDGVPVSGAYVSEAVSVTGISATEAVSVSGSAASGAVAASGTAVSGAATGGVSLAAQAGKKTAEKFREYLEQHTAMTERAIEQTRQNLQSVKSENQGVGSLPAFAKYSSAAAASVALTGAAVVVQVASVFLTSLLSIVLSVAVSVLAVVVVLGILFAALFSSTQQNPSAGYGLPRFITTDMMEAFFEVQEETGIPVSTGVAQVIAESGFGLYGPYGDSGEGLSKLAYDYKNLFGIQYFFGDQYASGVVNMQTGEQTEAGEDYTTVAGFSVYPDYASCIRQRAWMLEREPYASHVEAYLNPGEGSYTKEQARGFVSGIREAGWATDIAYVQKCVQHMDMYNLYRFDNMTFEEYKSGIGGGNYDGTVTPGMQRIVQVAENNQGTYPCTPDMCAAWVTGVYQAAGATVIPYGNAIDMWNTYRETGSTSLENIPPGAIVCGSGTGYMGSLYGHVGVYLGNGMVANNVGHHSIETLENWYSWQTANCQGHVGWIGWVYPGGVPTE